MREWLHYTEKPLRCTYYQKPHASPRVIIGSACFGLSFNLWFGHIYRVSTFCLNTPFQYNSSERVNFKWKNRLFGRLSFRAPSCRILNTVVSYYNRVDAKNSVWGGVRGRDELFRVGSFDERLTCHQIDDGLFVCALMSSWDRKMRKWPPTWEGFYHSTNEKWEFGQSLFSIRRTRS